MFSAIKSFAAGIGVALVGVLLISVALGPSGQRVPGAASPASPGAPSIGWTTERVALTADDFRIEVNDLVFGEDVWPAVHSDPGDSDYWTLEVDWTEQDLEQRIYMYFGSDGSDWWVDEIRTRDGYDPAEWVFAYGPFFQTPLGEAFEGDVTIDLLGKGRPGDPENLVPAVLSFSGMRLAVSPGAGPTPGPEDDVAPGRSPVPVDDGAAAIVDSTNAVEELCGSEGEYTTAESGTLCRALYVAIGDPQDGGAACLTVEEATAVAEEVLSALGMTGWSVGRASDLAKDGCATATVSQQEKRIVVLMGMHPDVKAVIEAFREYSLSECLDETTAVDTLSTRLNEIGRTDFVIEVGSMLGGPSDQIEEIRAHADAGCVFYVGVGAEADGTPVYSLHGE
jgi:hypothetical protein